MQAQDPIELLLERDELNVIIDALSKEPFRRVYKLIEKIHLQANAQLKTPTGGKPGAMLND